MKIIGYIPEEISSSDSKNWLCIEVQKKDHGFLVVKLRFPAFTFCMRQNSKKFMKVAHEKKLNNVKKIWNLKKPRAFTLLN